ncbi:ankyrin repeat-containing protein BDA1-like [Cornus florida]|uniref:ankyrin repeat-containing protein BDA1-like n=1 Tax=Cornus florida TaxID=4283 RepID=UPI0028968F4A|nr:ankyrin repeat-containing protein BDA1-like [Cornus florida]
MDPEYWRLMEISRTGNLPNFFEFYRRNSIVLDRYIDDRLLVDTPLHVAASMGNSHFAAEVLRLKPSYASKLNTSGLSPIHVALRNGRDEVVERLVEHDRNTVRHDAGEGRTALHYVIAQQNINLLRSFQLSCPDSIEDKTIRRETALHIALQHYNPMIFKRLVGWLKCTNKEYILNEADIDGNTVLHMATSNNQTEAVELLLSEEFN